VRDLSPLARLQRLEVLELTRTPVRDLAPLSALPSLRELHIADSQVRSLLPLLSLGSLRFLDLSRVPVPLDEPPKLDAKLRGLRRQGNPLRPEQPE
jgi:internalin A